MAEQAPYSYISEYYESVQRKNAAFPDVADFWLSGFRHVTGKHVLNLGCGPTFYDNFLHFGALPETYTGLDLNENSFRFLEQCDHPALIRARDTVAASGCVTRFITGDIFDHAEMLTSRFDVIAGIGFFGTFEGRMFDDLMVATRKMLKPGGKLLKMTWHGALRSTAETQAKLKYRYDNVKEPAAEELVRLIEQQGFQNEVNDVYICPPDTVGWRSVQVALFKRLELG